MIQKFDFLLKGLGIVSAPYYVWFFRINFSHVIFNKMTKFQCRIAFTSWDIGQYVYCNCLLTRLWRHKLWNRLYLSNQAVFLRQDKNVNILRTRRTFKIKYHFYHFLRAFSCQKLSRTWECVLKQNCSFHLQVKYV